MKQEVEVGSFLAALLAGAEAFVSALKGKGVNVASPVAEPEAEEPEAEKPEAEPEEKAPEFHLPEPEAIAKMGVRALAAEFKKLGMEEPKSDKKARAVLTALANVERGVTDRKVYDMEELKKLADELEVPRRKSMENQLEELKKALDAVFTPADAEEDEEPEGEKPEAVEPEGVEPEAASPGENADVEKFLDDEVASGDELDEEAATEELKTFLSKTKGTELAKRIAGIEKLDDRWRAYCRVMVGTDGETLSIVDLDKPYFQPDGDQAMPAINGIPMEPVGKSEDVLVDYRGQQWKMDTKSASFEKVKSAKK